MMDAMTDQIPEQTGVEPCPERPPVRRPILIAIVVILVFFCGIGAWAALAPLDSAAIAPGKVTVASNRKTVQHLEGGIIRELLVKEGDELEADQVIIRLDDTQARATLELLRSRQDTLLAREARLIAERDGADTIEFPASLLSRQEDPAVARLVAGEQAVFAARRRAIQGRIDIFRKRIGETELQIIDLENSSLNEAVSALREVQSQLVESGQRLRAAEDILVRTEIRAPQAGVVVGLNVHTETGVISPGQRLLDILPKDDALVIEAEVDPNDIDVVSVGLSAQVRLTAFKQRNTPPLEGEVTRVSADSFTHERTGATYFLARITIDPAERDKLDGGELYPGMPAEVMIVTGKQTAFEYFMTPVTDSFRRAFRED